MKRGDLFMGTTQIEVLRTIGDIQTYLVRIGATQVMTQFEGGQPCGLFFTILVDGRQVPFQLPARVEPIYKIMHAGRSRTSEVNDLQQAKRVAWRQIYRWIQAQCALIETGMVDAAEVLFPYIQTAPGETLYKKAMSNGFQKLLTSATE